MTLDHPANKIDRKMRLCLGGCEEMFMSESRVDRKCKICRRKTKGFDNLSDKLTLHTKRHLDVDNVV